MFDVESGMMAMLMEVKHANITCIIAHPSQPEQVFNVTE